jgi:hypothetical protein
MENKININQWIEKFNNGEYNNPDRSTQCAAGWYDWFCNDSSLAGKTKSLGKKLIAISKSPNLTMTQVLFSLKIIVLVTEVYMTILEFVL